MQPFHRQQTVSKLVRTAVECSVYLAPKDPGLTGEEVVEVGKRLGFQEGELRDALFSPLVNLRRGSPRLLPEVHGFWSQFNFAEHNPDYRNVEAFDFVGKELRSLAREVGARSARLDRQVLVERAVARNLPEREVEAAITIMVIDGHLQDNDGVVSYIPGRETWPTAGEQLEQSRSSGRPDVVARDEQRARTYDVVKDIIARRTDGRPRAVEPLEAFAEAMEELGYAHLRLWWRQMVAELRLSDTNLTPTTVSVLSAALVEGALTLVVKHARELGLGTMGSTDFQRNPPTWKIDELIASAAKGGDSAILDDRSRLRALELVRVRQRIHAGRMVSDYPSGVPDLRPEEAREARQTAELVVRKVLDWLERHPRPKANLPTA